MYPELTADGTVVFDTEDPVGKVEELLLRAGAEASGTDVAVSGVDVAESPADAVADVPYRLVREIEGDLEGAKVKEELSDLEEEPCGSDTEVSEHGM